VIVSLAISDDLRLIPLDGIGLMFVNASDGMSKLVRDDPTVVVFTAVVVQIAKVHGGRILAQRELLGVFANV
jgi:selenophosphate synthetase-related protein